MIDNRNPRWRDYQKGDHVLVRKLPLYHDPLIYEGIIQKIGERLHELDLLFPDGHIEHYDAWSEEILLRVSEQV